MPYKTTSDLPDSIRQSLPQHAQEIYLAAFNHAWKEYEDRKEHESLCHKVAWSAVKKKYHKVGDSWQEKK